MTSPTCSTRMAASSLADNREALQKEDPAKLKEVCDKVTAAVVADDAAGTVVFNLAQAWGPFLVTLAGSWAGIVDKKWIGENGGWDGNCDTWQNFYGVTSEELNKGKLGIRRERDRPLYARHLDPLSGNRPEGQ